MGLRVPVDPSIGMLLSIFTGRYSFVWSYFQQSFPVQSVQLLTLEVLETMFQDELLGVLRQKFENPAGGAIAPHHTHHCRVVEVQDG